MVVETVSLEVLRQRIAIGPSLLVDVRTPGEYYRLHAQGALSIPLDRLDPQELSSRRVSGDEPIYFICQSGARSAKACEKLLAAGVSPVYSVQGGTAAWQAAGLPVEHIAGGSISLERQVRIFAGILVVLGTVLGCVVHRAFLCIPLFVGSGLVFAGIKDYCGMGLLLAKMPWNKGIRQIT